MQIRRSIPAVARIPAAEHGVTLGVRAAILIGGAGASLAFVPLLFGPVWRIKEMPTAEEAPRT